MLRLLLSKSLTTKAEKEEQEKDEQEDNGQLELSLVEGWEAPPPEHKVGFFITENFLKVPSKSRHKRFLV